MPPPTLTPQEFVAKWKKADLKETAASQSHFIDLCALIGHQTPVEMDPTGQRFTFEASTAKAIGGAGRADVWYKGHFAWEYKGKHANLDKAYQQLLLYKDALENPPLLIVSDIETIVIHTNFTNTVKRTIILALDELLTPQGLNHLRNIFYDPDAFKAEQTTAEVTQQAAAQFSRLADRLRKYGEDPAQTAHFLIRLLFCLFAEDIGLLPKDLFTNLIQRTRSQPTVFSQRLKHLFGAMATGDWFGNEEIIHFNGGLFDDDTVLDLDRDGIDILAGVADLDWANIEPAILGTLFERGLDPGKRAQLGAHYTSKEDILLIVEPVLMAPLRRRWDEVQAQALKLAQARDEAKTPQTRRNRQQDLTALLTAFAAEIAQVRVLDPACGSGNFLYVALKQLLDLWKEVSTLAGQLGLSLFLPVDAPSPAQLSGIELNDYAYELAQTTIWIGYIQWLHDNGFGQPPLPILKPIQTIHYIDAILAYDDSGNPIEPEWPAADVIIGNPPFLGDKRMRTELGDDYVNVLRKLYTAPLSGQSDLVCYWFERTRRLIAEGQAKRAGLLATNSIRSGANREVLDWIKKTGDIFMAWSDREWILDGAAVRVSMVGFDGGEEQEKKLDGQKVAQINSDLTATVDITGAAKLLENEGICFLGMMKGGPFDIDATTAKKMLEAPINPNGRSNADVVKRRMGGQDVVRRPRDTWIIDFGAGKTLEEASFYELPFEYVREHVKPLRDKNRRKSMRTRWWIHGESRPGLRKAIKNLQRVVVTPEVSKHRVFIWMDTAIIPDHKLHVFARDDDYFLGVLHSYLHEIWSLAQGSWLGAGNDPSYSSSRTFLTFPFPWPGGQEPQDSPLIQAIAQAAADLVQKRDNWLNPPGASEKDLKKRTLTNLYNQRPTWLDLAHQKLDHAVLDAYGWPHDLSDDEILQRLLEFNLERAKRSEV